MGLVRALLLVGILSLLVFAAAFVVWMREGVDCNDHCSTAVEVLVPLGLPALVVSVLAYVGAGVAARADRRRDERRR